jgi:preprotein translocase subunit SecD
MSFRERWRIILLVVLLVLSGVALFAPNLGADTGPTNLQYGLQLDGGTRLSAPVDGTAAYGVTVNGSTSEFRSDLADELGIDVTDVGIVPSERAVEAYGNVSTDELGGALTELGYSPERVEVGVTETTRQAVVATIQSKVNAAGLSGGNVQTSRTATGQYLIVIEVPNADGQEVRDLVNERGVVRVVGRYPNRTESPRSYMNTTAISQEEIANVQPARPQPGESDQYEVPITLTQDGAERFASVMEDNGFLQDVATVTDSGVGNGRLACRYQQNPQDPGYCIITERDGNIVYSASMSEGLASTIESGAFVDDPVFVITANNESQAQGLRIDLQAGALPAPLDLSQDNTYQLSSELAQQFKFYSFLTGLIAVFAVAGVVFLRYGRPWVAVPMIFTALSEVAVLLGFAAAVGYPLDLSVIAGFIAVIGTGVDDLIIIADEVMTEEVSSTRVFQSRFRKALWVIGAAAATTIIAMSPLAVLSLGDLRGFAIVTILGVLVGVLITRPAYGDILRSRLTDH